MAQLYCLLVCILIYLLGNLHTLYANPSDDSLKIITRLNKARGIWYAKPDSAYLLVNEAIALGNESNYQKLMAKSYNYRGIVYDIKDNYDSALVNYNKAIDWAAKISDTISLAGAYNNIGLVRWNMGYYDKAIKNYLKALRIFEQIGRKQGIANALNNIGLIYWEQKRFDDAREYFREALTLRKELDDEYGMSAAYANIGLVYWETDQLDSSEFYLQKSAQIKKKINDKRGLAIVYNNLNGVLESTGKIDSATDYLLKAIELHLELGTKRLLASNYFTLGSRYLVQKDFTKAREYLIKGLEIARELKSLHELQIINSQLANLEKQAGNYLASAGYYTKALEYKDSVFSQDQDKAIIEMQEKYKAEKREKKLAEQRASLAESNLKLSRRNTLLIGMGTGMLFIIILAIVIYRQEKFKRQRLQAENKLKDEIAKVELQNKLNEQKISISRDLHDNIGAQLTFISSTVDYLGYSLGEGNKKLKDNMQQLSEYTHEAIIQLRDTVWAMKKSDITGTELSTKINQFMAQARRAANEVSFSFESNLDEKLRFTTFEGINLYRMVQEAINNAIKHANAKNIIVKITQTHGEVDITIRDDGKGFEKDEVIKQSGLSSLSGRAEDIKANLDIDSEPGSGTTITIHYPGS